MTRKDLMTTHIKSTYCNAKHSTNMTRLTFVQASTKNCSYTIWFAGGGVEFNVSKNDKSGRYSYSKAYPLPIHNALITHYNLAAQIKAWNESHPS